MEQGKTQINLQAGDDDRINVILVGLEGLKDLEGFNLSARPCHAGGISLSC